MWGSEIRREVCGYVHQRTHYLSDRVIHFCRNTGLPAMVSRRRDTIAGNPVFLQYGTFLRKLREEESTVSRLNLNSYGILGGKKTSPSIFGRNIAHVNILPYECKTSSHSTKMPNPNLHKTH